MCILNRKDIYVLFLQFQIKNNGTSIGCKTTLKTLKSLELEMGLENLENLEFVPEMRNSLEFHATQ